MPDLPPPRLPYPYRDEAGVVDAALARLQGLDWAAVVAEARPWVEAVRASPAPFWAMESLLREYPISSAEGLALMRLAEALLRVPDAQTAIALTADQLGRADFSDAAGDGPHRLLAGLSSTAIAMSRHFLPGAGDGGDAGGGLLGRLGARTVVAATVRAIQLLGRQFVLGRDIGEAMDEADAQRRTQAALRPSDAMQRRAQAALRPSDAMQRRAQAALRPSDAMQRRALLALRYSYDMLGEGARTDRDALRYLAAYQGAIAAIAARRAPGAGPEAGDGISIKLSALFPRYEDAQRERVFAELVPRAWALADTAARADMNLTIDAEESDRLELSLDVFEQLAARVTREHPRWRGFGLAVQAYQTRSLEVVDEVARIARGAPCDGGLRLMVRLVKGAYWDGEIKRAQEGGLAGYPVFTHKQHTDIAYLACARALIGHADVIYPQFASHNAATLAAIGQLARAAGARFEFQRLHGMGEGVYRELLAAHPDVPLRVYAPVGEHRDLLAYLVRRLLENGANSSFVHQLADESVAPQALLASPLARIDAPSLPAPRDLYGADRPNARGADLACSADLAPLAAAVTVAVTAARDAGVDAVPEARPHEVDAAMQRLARGFAAWNARGAPARAAVLQRAADRLESQLPAYCGLLVAEAHKTLGDCVAEVREAVDFLRYYALQATGGDAGAGADAAARGGRGVFVCISPWNFPLAIFAGQVAAALLAGNAVAAKPAEQTPAVAARLVALLHEAGVPADALALLHGPGETVGAALVAHPLTAGVAFTGSTQVAQHIQRALAASGDPLRPLIAETGGLNAMIVDSSALTEQVVDAVVQSAFRSAGQRCSALRLLCLHQSTADAVIEMLAGAMAELRVGDAAELATDVGPLIDAPAQAGIARHVERLLRSARLVAATPRGAARSTHQVPIAFEIAAVEDLAEEVFGPVLHIVRWGGDVDTLVDRINALGYGLTLGVQTRIDSRALRIAGRARVGNVYVNRNMIGAVVGVQPFGGEGLSGTGPKAGGPHYLPRFAADAADAADASAHGAAAVPSVASLSLPAPAASSVAAPSVPRGATGHGGWRAWTLGERCAWLDRVQATALAAQARHQLAPRALPGPTGESNELRLHARGLVACVSATAGPAAQARWLAALACGNTVAVLVPAPARPQADGVIAYWQQAGLPADALKCVDTPFDAALAALADDPRVAGFACDADLAPGLRYRLAHRPGAIVPVLTGDPAAALWRLAAEQTLTINTAAAGGNAALLAGA